MLKDNGHIDKLFSEGLKDLSVKPRPELWGKIQSNVAMARRKKRAAVIFISLAAAASIALLFTLSNNDLFNDNIKFQNGVLLSEDKTVSDQIIPDVVIEADQIEGEQIAELEKDVVNTDQKVKHQKYNNERYLNSRDKSSSREIIIQMALPETQKTALSNSQLPMKLTDDKMSSERSESSILVTDSLIIARNLKMLAQFDKNQIKKKQWSILGQISSSYSSYNGSKSGNKSENGIVSIGGGVKMNWQSGKKIAIQTGIIYNKFGQELGGQTQFFESAAFMNDVEFKGDNAFRSDLTTSAGNIKLKDRALQREANALLSMESDSPSADMVQSFEAIEIPFILRYNLIDRKFGLHLSGGFSTNLMVGNRVYDKSSRRTLGETSGIRTTNFSTSFSLGIEYQLSSKFSLSMEPSLKYYLNSINTNGSFNYKPYSIGLNSGLRYKF